VPAEKELGAEGVSGWHWLDPPPLLLLAASSALTGFPSTQGALTSPASPAATIAAGDAHLAKDSYSLESTAFQLLAVAELYKCILHWPRHEEAVSPLGHQQHCTRKD
ncbi:hypothetical protein EK904_002905, partial [Melospiza melodia maxima]